LADEIKELGEMIRDQSGVVLMQQMENCVYQGAGMPIPLITGTVALQTSGASLTAARKSQMRQVMSARVSPDSPSLLHV
jgi:hypothetical protein